MPVGMTSIVGQELGAKDGTVQVRSSGRIGLKADFGSNALCFAMAGWGRLPAEKEISTYWCHNREKHLDFEVLGGFIRENQL